MLDSLSTPSRAAVVVPIYNVEDYLEECLDSIVSQSVFADLEVVLVEDGSQDASPEIARTYARRYSNMRLIEKPNGGLGAARNTGLDAVTAPFVGFLDSDDVLPPDAYEKLITALERDDDADVAVGGMQTFPNPTEYHWAKAFAAGPRRLESAAEAPPLVHSASACNKLFRVSTWRDRSDSFPVGMHFEDAWTVVPFMLEARAIIIVSGIVYWYRKREVKGSIMDSLFTRPGNYWDYLRLIEHLDTFGQTCMPSERALLHGFMVRGFQGFLHRAESVLDEKQIPEFYERSYAVLKGISPHLIVRHVSSAPLRLTIGRLLMSGDRGDFRPFREQVERLGMKGSQPRLAPTDQGAVDLLITSGGFTVALESVTRRRDAIVLEGRITARGIPIDHEPDIQLKIGLGRRRFPAKWERRADRPEKDGAWSAFSARIPLKRWPEGEYFPRMVLQADGGTTEPRMMKTAALFRNARSFTRDGFRYEVGTNTKNQASVTKSAVKRGALPRVIRTALKDLTSSDRFGRWRLVARVLRRMSRTETWLLGERWDNAQDNGAALFRYLSEHAPDGVRVVYVLNKDAEPYAEMSRVGTVIAHSSLRHKLEICRASKLISAFDVDSYLVPREWPKNEYLEHFQGPLGTRRVFLQHGVAYRTDSVRSMHRLVMGYDLVVTSSKAERDYVSRELGYGRRAVLTGLPRFDALERIRGRGRKVILFAPTWRPRLVVPSYNSKGEPEDRGEFESSAYFRNIRELLESPALASMLASMGAELRFLPHYEASRFFASAINYSDHVRLADPAEHDFQGWLRRADIFVTDHSSTFFDAGLMKTPVVYYDDPTDPDADLTRSGAFFDAAVDGFGPSVEGVAELVDELGKIADRGFRMEDVYAANVDRFFEGVGLGRSSEAVAKAIAST